MAAASRPMAGRRRAAEPDPAPDPAPVRPGRRRRSADPAEVKDTGAPAPASIPASTPASTSASAPAPAVGRSGRRLRPADGDDELRFGAPRADLAAGPDEAPRAGATRADLVAGRTVGSAALAPRTPPEPDEVTDTGARRARSSFRVAPDAAEPEDDYDEPSLLLQWCVFVAQTLAGAAVGLGVWLGFYRLWSTWPLYAAPAVGLASIGMLAVARALRRRHGQDLDLLTAVVTVGVATVLTVLPAAFTLQSLA